MMGPFEIIGAIAGVIIMAISALAGHRLGQSRGRKEGRVEQAHEAERADRDQADQIRKRADDARRTDITDVADRLRREGFLRPDTEPDG